MGEFNTSTAPNDGRPGATVEAELHKPVHQVDGQEVAAANVVAVEQCAVRAGRLEDDLKLHEGQVAVEGLGPGGAGVRAHGLVEQGQRQQETWRRRGRKDQVIF